MIEWIGSTEAESNEVPWLREYITAGGDYDTPIDVEACFVGIKGVLVVSQNYKAFLFKGSKQYEHLLEALDAYLQNSLGNPTLICCGTESGKLLLGLDHDRIDAVWRKDQSAYHQHVKGESDFRTKRSTETNPLLAPTPIPTKTARAPKQVKQPPNPENPPSGL